MTSLEDKLLTIFQHHQGPQRSVSRKQLEIYTGEKDRIIRNAIANLRVEGYPIISLSKGYYWATGSDLVHFIRREECRAKTVLRVMSRLKKVNGLKGCSLNQLTLF